jgi:hypothetical protein
MPKAKIQMLDSSGEALAPSEFSFVNPDVMELPPTSFTKTDHGYVVSGLVGTYLSSSANSSWSMGHVDLFKDQKANAPEVTRREDYIDAAEAALIAGADHMEEHGYAIGADCDDDGRVCLRGAIARSTMPGFPHLMPHHRLAIDLVAEYLSLDPEDEHPVSWNDRTGRELGREVAEKEVVETMRLAYEKSRRDRGLL